MVTTSRNEQVINLEYEIIELQNLLQIASDQRDGIAAAYMALFEACKKVAVVARIETAESGVVYIVPVEALNQVLFILDGKPA